MSSALKTCCTVAAALCLLSPPAAAAAPATRFATDGVKGEVWLRVTWVAHPPVLRPSLLAVNTAGWVWYSPERKQEGKGFGAYAFQLSPSRLAALQQAVLTASRDWRLTRYKRGDITRSAWVEVEVPERSHPRNLLASPDMADYPESLRPLFSFAAGGEPQGLIPDLAAEARKGPGAFLDASVAVPKGPLRVGAPIPVTLAIANRGTLVVDIPLHRTNDGGGMGWAVLTSSPLRGRDPRQQPGAVFFELGPEVKVEGGTVVGADAARAVRLTPGQTLRLRLPASVKATAAGDSLVSAELCLRPIATFEAARPKVPYAPVDDWLRPAPAAVKITP